MSDFITAFIRSTVALTRDMLLLGAFFNTYSLGLIGIYIGAWLFGWSMLSWVAAAALFIVSVMVTRATG